MNEERFFRAYKALKDIETANDLRRAGLTLAEFREVQYCLQKYAASNGEEGATTIMLRVATWFGLHGFSVQPRGIGWHIG